MAVVFSSDDTLMKSISLGDFAELSSKAKSSGDGIDPLTSFREALQRTTDLSTRNLVVGDVIDFSKGIKMSLYKTEIKDFNGDPKKQVVTYFEDANGRVVSLSMINRQITPASDTVVKRYHNGRVDDYKLVGGKSERFHGEFFGRFQKFLVDLLKLLNEVDEKKISESEYKTRYEEISRPLCKVWTVTISQKVECLSVYDRNKETVRRFYFGIE